MANKDKCFNIIKDVPIEKFGGLTSQEVSNILSSKIKIDSPDRLEKINQLKDNILNSLNPSNAKLIEWQKALNVEAGFRHADSFKKKHVGLSSFIAGMHRRVKKATDSVAARSRANVQTQLGRLRKGFKDGKVLDFFTGSIKNNKQIDIVTALHDIDKAPTKESKLVAQTWRKIYEDNRKKGNTYGLNVHYLEGHILPQVHKKETMLLVTDSKLGDIKLQRTLYKKFKDEGHKPVDASRMAREEMTNTAREKWVDFQVPLLDSTRSWRQVMGTDAVEPSVEEWRDFLRHSFDTLTAESTDGHGFKAGNRRILHYKSPEGWLKNCEKYGAGNIITAMNMALQSSVERWSIAEKLGADPDSTYKAIKAKLAEKYKDDRKTVRNLSEADKYMFQLMKKGRTPVSYLAADMSKALRTYEIVTRLGKVVISSLTDHAQGILALERHNQNIFTSLGKYMHGYITPKGRAFNKAVSDRLGVGLEHSLGMIQSQYLAADTPTDKMAKLQYFMMKINGQVGYDNIYRRGTTAIIVRDFALQVPKTFGKLKKNFSELLQRFGIDENEWNLIRANRHALALDGASGKHFMAPDMALDFTPESLEEYAGHPLSEVEQDAIKEEIQTRLANMVLAEVDTTQIAHTIAQRAQLMGETQAGTASGVARELFMQFKGYMYGITRDSIGNAIMTAPDSLTLGRYALTYAVSASLLGYMKMNIDDLITEGKVPDPTDWHNWLKALDEGGFFGILGSIFQAIHNSEQGKMVDSLSGPVIGTAESLAKIFSTLTDFSNKGHRLSYHTRVEKQLVQFANNQTHGLLYTNNVLFKKVYLSIMNSLDPGYSRRINKLKEKEGRSVVALPVHT